MSYQKLIIVGNLGKDPEMRYLPDGTPVTTLSVATNRRWTNQDGSQGEETVWFRVSVWRKMAEVVAEHLSKGREVMVEGRLKPDPNTGGPRIWTRQDGTAGASYEMTADRVIFLGKKGDNNGSSGSGGSQSNAPEEEEQESAEYSGYDAIY